MKVMKYILMLCFVSSVGLAQIESVTFLGNYSMPLSKRLEVNKIDAVGGGIQVKVKLVDDLSLNINAGYSLFSLSQDSAIAKWDWRYWSRYSDFVNITLSEPAYSADLGAVQKMDLIPLYITFDYKLNLSEKIVLLPSVGAGVYFYNRRLYVTENWQKKFEDLGYTFDYSFRSFAPDKQGNPLFVTGGLNLGYYLFETFVISADFQYIHVVPTDGKLGYDLFPFENALNFNLGVRLVY